MCAEGGSQAWALDPAHARRCSYVVCTWNESGEFAKVNGLEHRQAFLVAPITAVEPARENPGRYILRFTEFTRINVPNVWHGQRNPVSYTTLEDLGIDPTGPGAVSETTASVVPPAEMPRLTGSLSATHEAFPLAIRAAKPRLAAYYEVPVEAIEIVIRG